MIDRADWLGRHDGNGFRALTELVPDFVAVADAAGVLRYASPAIERVLGYLPGEVIGGSFFDLIHPDDRPAARQSWAQLRASGEIATANLRFRHRDGSSRVLETLARSYHGTPEPKDVLVSTRDITQTVAREDALRIALERASDFYDNAPCGYHSLDANSIVVRINDTELRWLGRTREEVVGKLSFPELLSAASRLVFERCVAVFQTQGLLDGIELELVRKDGTVAPVLLSAMSDVGADGRLLMSRCTLHDIAERKRAESALRRVNRELLALNAVNSALIHAEHESTLLRDVCRICVELGGYRMAWIGFALPDEAKTVRPMAAFGVEEGYLERARISWADGARGLGPTGTAIRTGTVQVNRDFLTDPRMATWRDDALRCGYRSSIALPLKDSMGAFAALKIYAAEPDAFDPVEVRLLEEVAGDLAFGLLTLRARERQKRAEEEIQRLAFVDELTGLANRNALLDALGRTADRLGTGGAPFALLDVNVVRFNDIQSGVGVRKADDVLRQFAARLQQCLQPGELLARTGGDDFAVLLPECDAVRARDCWQRIEQALIAPFQQAGIPITVMVRVGAAIAPDDGIDPEVLLLHSGIAARQAKKKGDAFALYAGPTEAETPRHLALISELRAAIEGQQLIVHYQPKVALGSGQITGVEALVRWRHAERGLVPPDQFIPIAEQTGLIRPLTYGVLDMALQQCRLWATQGFALPVAVNVSVNNFNDPDFLRRIEDLLRTREVAAQSLQLEITESVLMEEPAQTLEILIRLKERGVSVSIDDFGTGYSSLSYVASLPIEALKIDRSFVRRMVDSARTHSVVAATIALAQSLGIKAVAEGVETREQAEMLLAMECSEIQGYLLCRPVDAEALRRWADGFSLASHGIAASMPGPDTRVNPSC